MKVLLLEPRINLRAIMRGVLHNFTGVDVITPSSALDAVQLLLSHDVDLLIASEESKPIIGEDLIKLIRASNDIVTRRTPIMIITSTNDIDEIKGFLASGCDEVLLIPFSYDAVNARINRVWKKRAAFLEYTAYVGPDRRRTERYGIEPELRNFENTPEAMTFKRNLPFLVKEYLSQKFETSSLQKEKTSNSPTGVILTKSNKKFNSAEDKVTTQPGVFRKFKDLEAGMKLAENIMTVSGMLVMDTKRPLTEQSIIKIKDLMTMGNLEDGFRVFGTTAKLPN